MTETIDPDALASLQEASKSMNAYQDAASTTAVYPMRGTVLGFLYTALALGETGELQGKAKKILRDSFKGMSQEEMLVALQEPLHKVITPELRQKMLRELGDILWEFSQCCYEAGFTLEEVAADNLINLAGRAERGTLHGSGDQR